MIGQDSNKVLSSFMLWLDHRIVSKGRAFTNYSGTFYPQDSQYSNVYSYGAPFSQFVYDSSISGANIGTGVYIGNTFVTTGQSGFLGYHYDKGIANFNTSVNNSTISGYFAIKDFSVLLNADEEETILFKTKYSLRPKYPQTITGLCKDCETYPLIYVLGNMAGQNDPFAFGGTDQANYEIRCVILADSLFNLNAVQGILRNSTRLPVALLEPSEMPFNVLGGLKSGLFNYTGIANIKINNQQFAFIDKVVVPAIGQRLNTDVKLLNPDVFFNFVDFELSVVGDFRSC